MHSREDSRAGFGFEKGSDLEQSVAVVLSFARPFHVALQRALQSLRRRRRFIHRPKIPSHLKVIGVGAAPSIEDYMHLKEVWGPIHLKRFWLDKPLEKSPEISFASVIGRTFSFLNFFFSAGNLKPEMK